MLHNFIKTTILVITMSSCAIISPLKAMQKRSREIIKFSNDDIIGYKVSETDGEIEAKYNKKTKKYQSTKTSIEGAIGPLIHHMPASQAKMKYLLLKKTHKKQQTEKK